MLHFIPAWYQQNNWRENEQYWYSRRMRTEFDDTVKHIQLFHRSKAYPFRIMLLSYAPNFRHFLHRQSVFHAPYWSCFDAIQEVRRKHIKMFSFHNLSWPEHIEFVYSPFALIARLNGHKYAQAEFAEDGNLIQVDIYQNEKIVRRNIYDDRGFVSGSIVFDEEGPLYQDYLTDKGIWKIREYFRDGHVEVNPRHNAYLIEDGKTEQIINFNSLIYENMSEVIKEVLASYINILDKNDLFCAAMHELHTGVLNEVLKKRKLILSFFGDRYDIKKHQEDISMINTSDYVIADSQENYRLIKHDTNNAVQNIINITPFDSRVDFGISQQLNVQKVLIPIDGIGNERFEELIVHLGQYIPRNDNVRIHLFTRKADYNRKQFLLALTGKILAKAGMEPDWAREEKREGDAENRIDGEQDIPVRFFVEQCVDELSVSKCIREQRLVIDMRKYTEVYLRIMGISVGIPQIVYHDTEFVEDGKNGRVIKDMSELSEAMEYYLESLNNWNEAMVCSYELGERYTTEVLIDKWKEVIDFVRKDSDTTTGK